jgi:hypothetical protein
MSAISPGLHDHHSGYLAAGELRALEERYRAGSRAETVPEMAAAVRGRYDLAEDEVETVDR